MTVRNLQPAHGAARAREGKAALRADDEIGAVEHDFDPFGRNPRQRDNDDQLDRVLEDIDRRLPHALRPVSARGPEELPVHAIGLVDQLAGLCPHPVSRNSGRHRSSPGWQERRAQSTPARCIEI